jgi:hypothetical protein
LISRRAEEARSSCITGDAQQPSIPMPLTGDLPMPVALNYTTGLSNAWSNVATFIPKFVVFLIILVVGWLIAKSSPRRSLRC